MAKKSSEYAVLPAGTAVSWGRSGVDEAEFKLLINCKGIGKTGATGGFVDVTTLIDKEKQAISDLPDGPEKDLTFIDDPANQDFADFLTAAENRETVQFRVELPNGRISKMLLSLSGWEMSEIDAPANAPITITVKGKQNNLAWTSKAAPAPKSSKA